MPRQEVSRIPLKPIGSETSAHNSSKRQIIIGFESSPANGTDASHHPEGSEGDGDGIEDPDLGEKPVELGHIDIRTGNRLSQALLKESQ
jgi:hypothetical protein